MAEMDVTVDGYKKMTQIVNKIAEQHCDGKMVMILEGGYDTRATAYSVAGVLEVMSGSADI